MCTKFKDAAITLKLKANAIEEAVTDAYNKGITKAQDIQATIENFLKEQVVNKECKDFLEKNVRFFFASEIRSLCSRFLLFCFVSPFF